MYMELINILYRIQNLEEIIRKNIPSFITATPSLQNKNTIPAYPTPCAVQVLLFLSK